MALTKPSCQSSCVLCVIWKTNSFSFHFLTSVSSLFSFWFPKICPPPTIFQVRQLQESAAQLRTVYAGEKAEAIACREHEVMQCWKELLTSCEECRLQITTETDKLRFFSMVRDQIIWMDSIICQIGTGEKPRYLHSRSKKTKYLNFISLSE